MPAYGDARAMGAAPDDDAPEDDVPGDANRDNGAGPAADAVPVDEEVVAGPGRYAVTTYVPPEPAVQFTDRRHRTPEEREADRAARRRRRRRRRVVGWIMIAAGAAMLIAGAWVSFRAYQAYTNLDAAAAKVQQLQGQLTDPRTIDDGSIRPLVASLQVDAAGANSAVDDPLYQAATVIPWVGPNLDAVARVSETVDTLARDVMPSLVEVATTLEPDNLAPVDGRIPLSPITQISPALQRADQAIDEALVALGTIDRSELVRPVGEAVNALGTKLQRAAEVTDPAARIARLAPGMLGANGPRTWLVVFQNPAEPRATGGIFGSFALVRADQGRIDLLDQGASSRVLGEFTPPLSELTTKELQTFGPLMARFPQDVNLTPNFPRAAELFAQMYTERTGTAVDGVVAVDPVALSYLLRGSPPLTVDGITLNSDNLVETLLVAAYAAFDGVDQSARDDFLAAASGHILAALSNGDIDTASAIDGLRQGVRERRVLMQSDNPDEQADLATTDLAGTLESAGPAPTVGVFLNDATAAKLGYYLKPTVRVTEAACRDDGRRELAVAVTLSNMAPPAETSLPHYVMGDSALGAQHGVLTNVVVAAPLGGGIVSASQDGRPTGYGRGEDQDHEVGTVAVQVLPGESKTVEVTVLGPPGSAGQDVQSQVVGTPGVHQWDVTVEPYRTCKYAG